MTLAIPEKLRAFVAPRRSLPGFAVAPTEKAAARELVRIAKHFSKKQPGWDKSHKQIFAAGLDARRDGFSAIRKAAHAFWDAPSLEAVKSADIETLAFAEIVAHRLKHDADFTSVIVAVRGALDALSVMARALDLGLDAKGGYTTCVFVVEVDDDKSSRWAADWLPIRHAICAMSDADYARARQIALAERKKRVLTKRARIAFAFPDETWAKEDLLEGLAMPRPFEISFLLGTCGDAALIRSSRRCRIKTGALRRTRSTSR